MIKIEDEVHFDKYDLPILLVRIDKSYIPGKSDLDKSIKEHWRLKKDKVVSVRYVCGVYRGIIQRVYKPDKWLDSTKVSNDPKAKNRLYFEGKIAESVNKK